MWNTIYFPVLLGREYGQWTVVTVLIFMGAQLFRVPIIYCRLEKRRLKSKKINEIIRLML